MWYVLSIKLEKNPYGLATFTPKLCRPGCPFAKWIFIASRVCNTQKKQRNSLRDSKVTSPTLLQEQAHFGYCFMVIGWLEASMLAPVVRWKIAKLTLQAELARINVSR